MQQVPHSLPYKKELDGIRGVAIILVVLFHIWPQFFSFGFVGVDIFFVLSGYLITKIIINKAEKNCFSLYEFYRNRIRRIFPALIIVLFATAGIGYLFLFPEEFEVLGKHLKSSALFYQNFRLIDEAGYWDESSHYKPLLHFWSLSIEEQFYIIWPLVIVILVRLNALYLLPLIALVLFFISCFLHKESATFFHSLTRSWELALGSMLVWLERFSAVKATVCKARYLIWMLLLVSIGMFYQENSYVQSKTFLLVLSVGLLIVSLHERNDFFLSKNWLVFFGIVSYPLYLWHYPIISYAHIFGFSVVDNGIWILISSIVLSYLTFRYIEVNARNQTNIRIISGFVILVLFIAGLGRYISKNDGLTGRGHLAYIKETELQFIREPAINKNCEKISQKFLDSPRVFDYCKSTSASTKSNYVALIGDSHAHVLYPGFSEELQKNGFETILLSNASCPSLLGGARGRSIEMVEVCRKKIRQIYEIVNKLSELSKVIIITRGPTYSEEIGFGAIEDRWTRSPAKHESYYKSEIKYNPRKIYFNTVKKSVEFLTNKGLEVFFFLENPELGFSPKTCVVRPFDLKTHSCSVDYKLYQQRMGDYRNKIRMILDNYQNAYILDPEPFLCDGINCYASIQGKMLYADGDHFSVEGSRYIAGNMINKIVKERE